MVDFPKRPKGVNVNAAADRGWGSGWPRCQESKQTRIKLDNGVRIQVRRELGPLLTMLLNEVGRRGYRIRQGDTGGFCCRQIFRSDGTPTGKPSNHSWGLAVDINWDSNKFQKTLKTNLPPWSVSLMWAYGFFWGGWYNGTKDAMHFEFVKTPQQAEKLTRVLARTLQKSPGGLLEGDVFNPYFVKVKNKPAVFIVTTGGVSHVKNPTHMKFLIKGGVSETITFVTEQEMRELTVPEP
jgi:hypothetical protein